MTDDQQLPDEPPTCPECNSAMKPIVYGYPGGGMFEAAERGQIVLGGCLIYDGQPAWRCASCQPERASQSVSQVLTVAEDWASRPRRSGPSADQ